MDRRLVQWIPWLLLLMLGVVAFRFDDGMGQVRAAQLAHRGGAMGPTATFGRRDTVYCFVELAPNAVRQPIRAVWQATNAAGLAPCTIVHEDRVISQDDSLKLMLPNDGLWPEGKYRLDLYVDERLDRSLVFRVQ